MTRTTARLARFRRDTEGIRAIELTPRDKEVIRQVGRFRFLRSTHIMRLVGGAPAQVLRRLQALYHHGWLDRPRCQIDFFHRGGSRTIAYGLGSRGASLLRREFDIPFSRMVWSRAGESVGRVFLEHTLMIADILIAVQSGCRDSREAVRFVAEEELAASHATRHFRWSATFRGRRIGLIPDAVCALDFADAPPSSRRVVCFVEADRGTMPVRRRQPHLSSVGRKFAAYATLWKEGRFATHFGTPRFVVLTVTTGPERARHLVEAINTLPYGHGLFTSLSWAELEAGAAPIIESYRPRDALVKI